ncbi:MAG: PhoD-like phosphatase N-terminal domain-containing protein [Gammaproteobacteria bacterium]|nr:PhoD-like phosphatase N-terminal domain-containing protein [Gammaproteobacteria bacterium]
MPPLDRRGFLAGAGLAAALGASGCAGTQGDRDQSRFAHGVASGDPGAERVVIWTRLDGATAVEELEWLVAREPQLRHVVRRGRVMADPLHDFCCKVDVGGLEPGTTCFYAFRVHGEHSVVGRTRTLPQDAVESLRFAVAACANYQQGSFAAYARASPSWNRSTRCCTSVTTSTSTATRPTGACRLDPPHEILTLEDYRRRCSTGATPPCKRPIACIRSSRYGTITRARTTPGATAPATTTRRAKAPGASAAPRQYRCGTNGCRCAIPRHTRRSIAASVSAISRTG